MTDIFKRVVQFKLKWFAKIYLWRIKPYVIVVAGTVGRHWIKEAVKESLTEKNFSVRANKKNFNAEIGLPLSILDLPSGEGSFSNWIKILWLAMRKVFSPKLKSKPFDEFLVLEMAIDRPANMNYLLSIVKPGTVVLTAVTMIYRENFEDLDEIALEYRRLIKALPRNGLAILNFDDERIMGLARRANCRIITFGLKEGADFTAKNIQKISDGQKFEIGGLRQSVKINRFGKHHLYAALVKEIIRNNFKEHQKEFFSKLRIL